MPVAPVFVGKTHYRNSLLAILHIPEDSAVHRSDTAHHDLPVVVKDNPEAMGEITSNKRFLQSTHPTNKVSDKLGVYSKSPKVADVLLYPRRPTREGETIRAARKANSSSDPYPARTRAENDLLAADVWT
jgi:hypothetical protein